MKLAHHDLCFGCGTANLFGLQMELEQQEDGTVAGRFFVKQDHQGPPGVAHGGIVAAALDEAMALVIHAEGIHAVTVRLELDLKAPAPVGGFVVVEAAIERREQERVRVSAVARADGDERSLAKASGTFALVKAGDSAVP